jgi:polyhydroxyalkanoate synthesis regulator phasin
MLRHKIIIWIFIWIIIIVFFVFPLKGKINWISNKLDNYEICKIEEKEKVSTWKLVDNLEEIKKTEMTQDEKKWFLHETKKNIEDKKGKWGY